MENNTSPVKSKKPMALTIGVLALIALVVIVIAGSKSERNKSIESTTQDSKTEMTIEAPVDEAMMKADNSAVPTKTIMNQPEAMMKPGQPKESTMSNSNSESMMKQEESSVMENGQQAMMKQPGEYLVYSQSTFESNQNNKRVLFFHASWCPSCKASNTDFMNNASDIPSGVVVLKTDYDMEKELKKKYGITYQHTFVHVDAKGNEIVKWNGGGVKELADRVR